MPIHEDIPAYRPGGSVREAPTLEAGLYVVATPIGNLRDITIRALETLAAAELILCEDTRTSKTLLEAYGIKTPRRPMHEHNERARIGEILDRLRAGAAIALISDAGTPLVSDPGFPLVRAAREEGLPVFAVPGPSALLAALSVAGLPTDAFSFFGFLPARAGQRDKALAALAGRGETLVFFESPRRLAATLAAMAERFGAARPAAVALELTKRFERIARGSLAELAGRFAEEPPRGEAVIVIEGAAPTAPAREDWQAALDALLEEMTLRQAVDRVVDRFGVKRKEVYDAALAAKAAK